MLARIGAALDSEIVSLGAGPTHLRVTGPTTLSGSIDVKTSKNAGVALLCASLLNRGRTTLRKVARIEEVNRLLEVLDQPRRPDPLAQRRQRPRDHPAGRARPRPHRRGRRAAYPLGDHVPRPAAAPCRGLRAALRRRLQPRHPHRRAAHGRAATVRARGQGHRRQLPRPGQPRRSSRSRPIVLTERGDTVTENALMAAALHPGTTVIRNASSNYMVQDLCFFLQRLGVDVQGIGTTTLTVTGRDRDRRRRRLRARARTRSRRCRCWPRRSSPSRPSPSSGCRSSSSRSSSPCWRRWASSTPAPRSTSPQRSHPAGRPHHQPSRAARAARQDPPDAVPGPQHRQPAVLRGDRRRRHRARPSCTTGSTRTARSTSPSSTSSAARSSCSTRTG